MCKCAAIIIWISLNQFVIVCKRDLHNYRLPRTHTMCLHVLHIAHCSTLVFLSFTISQHLPTSRSTRGCSWIHQSSRRSTQLMFPSLVAPVQAWPVTQPKEEEHFTGMNEYTPLIGTLWRGWLFNWKICVFQFLHFKWDRIRGFLYFKDGAGCCHGDQKGIHYNLPEGISPHNPGVGKLIKQL